MKKLSDYQETTTKKDFIVKDLLKSNGLYFLVARPKVGKSLLALQLAESIATGKQFLGFETKSSPVLYISTEMNFAQIIERIKIMNLQFNDENFCFIEQEYNKRKLNLYDLQLDFQNFHEESNGKLVIIDMLYGIDFNVNYDLNNYQDISQNIIPKLRELCNKYNLTILFIHHLNKNNTSLGSTALDGTVDGKITLKQDYNIKNKIYFEYESRDYESINLILERDEKLNLNICDNSSEELNSNLQIFLNYAIKQKSLDFTPSEITSKLNLNIVPSSFGKLLNNNFKVLEKEGLHIELRRTSTERRYYANYVEPDYE